MASKVTSFAVTSKNRIFLERAKNKSEFINNALDAYRKYILARDMRAGFQLQDDEDIEFANMGFDDYLKIIDVNEND